MILLKKTVYDKLVAKVNNIDTSDFVLKTKYSTDKAELEKKIPNVTDFVIVAKLTELGKKIPYVSNLATKTALTAAENKMPTVNNLVKKTDYNTKISDPEKKFPDHNHNKYITTPEFNKLAADAFNARLAQANLITKTDIDAKLSSLNRKITKNKSKHLLVENEFKKLKTFDLSYFTGKNYFENDGTQNYLVFQPIDNYLNLSCLNLILTMVFFQNGNLKDCLIKLLNLLILALPQYQDLKMMKKDILHLEETV